jgi:iron complex outermembrane receptor protein
LHSTPTVRRAFTRPVSIAALTLGVAVLPQAARAQRAEENAVASAEDAFGTTVGHETIGLYDDGNVRGFSPSSAGNIRVEGMFFDIQGGLSSRVLGGEVIHVGPSTQGYLFPAPTGIADLSLRSIGAKQVVSTIVSTDSFGTASLELDAQIPIAGRRFGVATGFGISRNHYNNGGGNKHLTIGAVPHWRPSANVEVTAFYHRDQQYDSTSGPIYIPTGAFLPPRPQRGRYPGPSFEKGDSWSQVFGLLGKARLGDWALRAGLFHSEIHSNGDFANLIVVNSPLQIGTTTTDRQVYAYPANSAASYSGEVRLSRLFSDGPRRHLLSGTVRSRIVDSYFGGGDFADLGPAALNDRIGVTLPPLNFTNLTHDATRQFTGGLSYSLAWHGLGEMTLGVQRTHYVKTVEGVRGSSTATLPYISATVPLGEKLSLYGSFVRGLEDAGTAPNYATNANMVLPANRTRQHDFGLRFAPAKGTVLILGYFDIAKPYIALDRSNFFGQLGAETHRGIEVSLASQVSPDLRIVTGGVFLRARVSATPSIAEKVGPKPVNQPDVRTRFNVNYTLPFAKAVTLDAYVNHDSAAVGTVDNSVISPGSTRIGGGFRYRFKLGSQTFTARAELYNIFNAFEWVPVGSGVYAYNTQRNVTAYLTADF